MRGDNGRMDVNKLAYKIVQQSIGEEPIKKKNPRASKRGDARAKVLTSERRSEIASKAAKNRWSKISSTKVENTNQS